MPSTSRVIILAVQLATAAAWSGHAGTVLSRRTPIVTMALPAEVLEVYNGRFIELGTAPSSKRGSSVAKVDEDDVSQLWDALLMACNNDEECALAAAKQNPTIISPLYSNPVTVAASKEALLKVMEGDEREALDIILQNPAILQCGKSLSNQRADEIKSFARMRSFADRVPPQISQGILVLVLGTVLLNIVLSKSDDPAVLDLLMVLKPLLGGTFALAFLGTISMVGMGEAAASRAKRSKKEE